MSHGSSRNPNDRNVELPEEFLALIEATHETLKSWTKMKELFAVAKQTYQGNKGKPGWIKTKRGDAVAVLRVCLAFYRRLPEKATPAGLRFGGEAIAALKNACTFELLKAEFQIDDTHALMLHEVIFATEALGKLLGVPPLPEEGRYLDRAEDLCRCRDLLLSSSRTTVAITAPGRLALRGMGGAGKSVLAKALAHDRKVRKFFRDGLIWIEVGSEAAGDEMKALRLQSRLAARLGVPFNADTRFEGIDLLRNNLTKKRYLIILDDVWNHADASWLDVTGTPSRILITTRQADLVRNLGADEFRVVKLTESQALDLLQKRSGIPAHGDRDAEQVARECGYLPLALVVSGALAAGGLSWKSIAAGLSAADLSFLDQPGIDPEGESVLRSIQASFNFLDKTDSSTAALYRKLAVFPPDATVPVSVVSKFWEHAAECSEAKAELSLCRLRDRSLLELLDEPQSSNCRVALHDLHHDYLRYSQPRWKDLHQEIVNAYRKRCPGRLGWAGGPFDGYFFQYLPYHLEKAGFREERMGLLLNCAWLEAKLRATDVIQLLADFEPFAEDDALRLVSDALRLSAHQLACEPGCLKSQLYGRLLGVASPEVLTQLYTGPSLSSWLRCCSHGLLAPGSALIRTLSTGESGVEAVAITDDGKRAVSASRDSTLRLWDLDSGALIRELPGAGGFVCAVTFTADGKCAVSGSSNGTLRLWDLDSGKLIRELRTDCGDLRSKTKLEYVSGFEPDVLEAVALAADRKRVVYAWIHGTLRLWDVDSGTVIHELPEDGEFDRAVDRQGLRVALHRDLTEDMVSVRAVAITVDCKRAVYAMFAGALSLVDLVGSVATCRRLSGDYESVGAVAVTADGKRAVSGSTDGTLRFWNLESGDVVRDLPAHQRHPDRKDSVDCAGVTGDGKLAILERYSAKTLRFWEPDSGDAIPDLCATHHFMPPIVAVSADGARAVAATFSGGLMRWDLGNLAGIDDVRRNGALRSFEVAAAITADGKRAVSSLEDGTLRLWDLDAGKLIRVLRGDDISVHAVAVAADGKRAVSGSRDGTLRIWDLDNGALIRVLVADGKSASAVTIAADGKRAVFGSEDGTLRLWDVDAGAVIRDFPGAHQSSVTTVAITANGKRAVSGSEDGTLRVWDLSTGNVVASFVADYALKWCVCSQYADTIVAGDGSGRVHALRLVEA